MTSEPSDRPPLPAIGWREWLALPDLGVAAIKAKVDTGARTSALHAFDTQIEVRGGERWVRFCVHPIQGDDDEVVETGAPLVEERTVRSSNGQMEDRPVIVTTTELAGRRFQIELTLTRRDEMGFRMLLGREAVKSRFVVDPQRSYIVALNRAARDARRATRRARPA
jgi:hypothetical protein